MRPAAIAGSIAALVLLACDGTEDRSATGDTISSPAPPGGGVNASAEPVIDSAPPPAGATPSPASGAGASPPSIPIVGADTALGTVSLLGTAADSRVVVRTATGPIAVAGPHAVAIGRLEGMDVWIQGPVSMAIGRVVPPRQMTVERFEIRGVSGVPVLDGTLRQDGETLVLVNRRGTPTRLTTFPAGLRDLVGRRVWVTRAADGAVASFGPVGE
ncbi:MAG TPA: hypothetical protein VK922_17900 [Gemmatimonadaceae bacterium]|nr:hypothetical protein [Gemmatimonadaceae bacterium]